MIWPSRVHFEEKITENAKKFIGVLICIKQTSLATQQECGNGLRQQGTEKNRLYGAGRES